MSPTRIEVARAGPDRLSALAPVFGRAFVDEPMMRWPMGEHGDVADCFTRCFGYFLEEALGLGVVWEAGTAKGAAVWVPPDRWEAWEEDHPWNQPRINALADDGGRRFGAALIAAGLERARADGVGAFLSTGTAHNVSIYGRCGFRVVKDVDPPGGGPHIWFMRWDP